MTERTQVPIDTDEIDRSLRSHTRLRLWLLGYLVCVCPVILVVAMAGPPGWLMGGFVGAALILWVALVMAHQFYRCPRCHRFFHVRGVYGNAFASKCLNCGLPL